MNGCMRRHYCITVTFRVRYATKRRNESCLWCVLMASIFMPLVTFLHDSVWNFIYAIFCTIVSEHILPRFCLLYYGLICDWELPFLYRYLSWRVAMIKSVTGRQLLNCSLLCVWGCVHVCTCVHSCDNWSKSQKSRWRIVLG